LRQHRRDLADEHGVESLRRQTRQDFEVIIVIDGSTDNTVELVQKFESTFEKTIVLQENQGRSIAKNNGVDHAKGNLLVFFDDDMTPEIESINRHIGFHKSNRGILSGNPIELESENKTDIQNYKALLTKKWTEKYHEGLNELNRSNLFFASANCSMSREVFIT